MIYSSTCWFFKRTKKIGCFSLLLLCWSLLGKLDAQNCPTPILITINEVLDSSAAINWPDVSQADQYLVEYGPADFPPGAGVMDTVVASNITLDSLNPCVDYVVYIYSVCGGSISAPLGPEPFTTTSPDVCTYTFSLFDEFGDTWNGGFLTVSHKGEEMTLAPDLGQLQVEFELEALKSVPICINYSPGFADGQVSFFISGPDGLPIYSDGPFPDTGNILNILACDATCSAPKTWEMGDINADNATTTWSFLPGDGGDVFLEYGPMGFMRGTGTKVNVPAGQLTQRLIGLEEKTWYNLYLGVDCGADSSKVIGPLVFETLWMTDVGVTSIIPNADDFCNLGLNETITVGLTNFGQLPQTLFDFFYSVNGVVANIPMPQDGFFTGVVGNDSTQLIQFETTYDFDQPGLYVIEAWTAHEEDGDIANDTFRVEFLNSFPYPLQEDFEDLDVPIDWVLEPGTNVVGAGDHNNPTAVAASNLYAGNLTSSLTTGRVGPLQDSDTLSFDYRYVNWSDDSMPTEFTGADSLLVQISDDCGESFETVLVIDSANHVPTTDMTQRIVLLEDYDYEGLTIMIRFVGIWDSGDYWLDLDNINLFGDCPASFGPLVEIEGAFENDTNGKATITPIAGTGPYTFEWSTGDTQMDDIGILENIGPGPYFVDITDANGCMETIIFDVGTLVAADEIHGVEEISIYPNPTNGLVNLIVELANAKDVQTRIMDMSGRLVFELENSNVFSLKKRLDLSGQPDGLYIVQVVADGKPYYAKLMVSR